MDVDEALLAELIAATEKLLVPVTIALADGR